MTHVEHSVSDQTGHETVAAVPTVGCASQHRVPCSQARALILTCTVRPAPQPVVDRLTKALTYNLTSIMTDSVGSLCSATVGSRDDISTSDRGGVGWHGGIVGHHADGASRGQTGGLVGMGLRGQ